MSDDLDLAASLVRDAGQLAATMLRDGLTTMHKTSVSDVVSAADHAAEELVTGRLQQLRPGDRVVGEEGAKSPGERTWFVDPVDGTYNFLSGLPTWCSALALADADGPVVGAVYQPVTDELWLGGRNHPSTLNGVRLPSLADRPLAELSVASYLHPTTLPDDGAREPLQRVWQAAATVRMLGSGSIELAAVAAGRLGAWVQIDSLDWDWLPGRALVEAAGGATAVFEATGHRWHVAGPPRAVAEITALIQGRSGRDLRARLTALAEDAGKRLRCTPRLTLAAGVDRLPGPVAESVEAVLTAALDNTVRHAYASGFEVSLAVGRKHVTLTVKDDGVGPSDHAGGGITDMMRRAEALGGTCSVLPNRPLGTVVSWQVPR